MFRFTIRDVLWLTVLVAIVVAWWIDHSRKDHKAVLWRKRANVAADVLTGEGWNVQWDDRPAVSTHTGSRSSSTGTTTYFFRQPDE